MGSNDGQVEVDLPGGFKTKIFGRDAIHLFILAGILGYLAYINWNTAQDHQSIAKELRINTYILSLPQDKRPELVPPSEVYERMRIYSDDNRYKLKGN